MCKSDLAMYKGVKEIFDGRFLSHKYNRKLNIWHTLSLTPNIKLRFARPPISDGAVLYANVWLFKNLRNICEGIDVRRILSANSDMILDMISEKNLEIISESFCNYN